MEMVARLTFTLKTLTYMKSLLESAPVEFRSIDIITFVQNTIDIETCTNCTCTNCFSNREFILELILRS